MVGQASAQIMEDGRRLHLQHGPIDIMAEAFGAEDEVQAAYHQGAQFFETVLQSLVIDLDFLRKPVDGKILPELGLISQQMWHAAYRVSEGRFVTPMAAVAGAVADAVLASMAKGRDLQKLYVNNGGDIALYLNDNARFVGGVVNNQDAPDIDACFELTSADNVGGIATSGWRGRSLSPGIADAVTVLAKTSALADVAATIIAGDVWVENTAIKQEPAKTIRDDTDLGDMPVTIFVGNLDEKSRSNALENGLKTATSLYQSGLIDGAYLALQGDVRSLSSMTKYIQREVA
ncbi:hypothetical protein A9Q83_01725 [Alphaproteobacteria bacterium 46_93_T64]|nr:hypothetical protein A9Q83_01725 [Alphaproteobacteria bacterium 46_93_T64]